MSSMLNVNEAAEILGTKPRFIRRLIAENRIRHYKLGAHVRINVQDLERFIEDGRIDPPSTTLF